MKALQALAVLAVTVFASPLVAERLSNPVVGISMDKPETWRVLTAKENAENLRRAEIGTPEFQEAISKYAAVPLLAVVKYEEPYPDVNPSVKLNTRPVGEFAGKSGKEILAATIAPMESVLPDFVITIPPEDVVLAGTAAGHVLVNYLLKADGQTYPTTSELWIVPQGDYYVVIGAGYRRGSEDEKEEVHAIVESIDLPSTE